MSKLKIAICYAWLVVLVFTNLLVQGQVKRTFSGTMVVSGVTAGGSSEFVITGTFADQTNIYGAAGITEGCEIIDSNGNMYIVRKVNARSPVNVDVEYPGTGFNKTPAMGNALIYLPTSNNRFPQTTTGIALKADVAAFNHLAGTAEETISGIMGAMTYCGLLSTDTPLAADVEGLTPVSLKNGSYAGSFDQTLSAEGYFTVAVPVAWRGPELKINGDATLQVLQPVGAVTIGAIDYLVWQTDVVLPAGTMLVVR